MEYDILSQLVITRVHSASTIYTEKNMHAKRENRPCWAIIIKFEGETVYTVDGKKYVSNANNIFILPKGSSYEWMCTEAGHFADIEFECDITYDKLLRFNVKSCEKLLNMFREIEYKQLIKKPMYEIESIRDCYSIILKLISSSEKKYSTNAKQKKILPAVEYIAKHYNERLTNETLAGVCGLSTVYFRKLFTDIFGISPMTYIQGIRIKKAKEMLRSDFGSISDVAQSLGYTSIYDFSRAFKKHTGMAPMKYTKMRKEK